MTGRAPGGVSLSMTIRAILTAGVAAVFLVAVAPARASCLFQTPSEQRARAQVIVDGVALEGPTRTGVQRFRVTRYLKGSGPSVVRVRTGTTRRLDGTLATTSVSLFVARGERWRVFALGSPGAVLSTTLCDGSRRRHRRPTARGGLPPS